MAELFRDIVRPGISVGTRQWYTVPLSIITHTVGLVALVVIPIVASDALPTPQSVIVYATPPPPPPPKSPPPLPPTALLPPAVEEFRPNAAPIEAPATIAPEPTPTLRAVVQGIPPALSSSGPIGVETPPPPKPTAPVRVGGSIKAPSKIKDATPIYPAIAKAARISGTVFIEAVITRDGSIKNLRVTRSAGVLDQAALDAVSQWKYTPTMLNNEPVEVIMTVTVNFALH